MTYEANVRFPLQRKGCDFSLAGVMEISSSSHRQAMLHAMKLCYPGTVCGLSQSRSISMILMASATFWVQLSPSHIQPSLPALWTLYRYCFLFLSLFFSSLCLTLHWICYAFRLFFLLIWSVFERSLQKIAMSCGLLLALNRVGPLDQWVFSA